MAWTPLWRRCGDELALSLRDSPSPTHARQPLGLDADCSWVTKKSQSISLSLKRNCKPSLADATACSVDDMCLRGTAHFLPQELEIGKLFLAPDTDRAGHPHISADSAPSMPQRCHADAPKQRLTPAFSHSRIRLPSGTWAITKLGLWHLVSLLSPSLPYMARGQAGPVSNDDQPAARYRETRHHQASGPWSPPI